MREENIGGYGDNIPNLPSAEQYIEDIPELRELPSSSKKDVAKRIAFLITTVEEMVSEEPLDSIRSVPLLCDMPNGDKKVIVALAEKTQTSIAHNVIFLDRDDLESKRQTYNSDLN